MKNEIFIEPPKYHFDFIPDSGFEESNDQTPTELLPKEELMSL